MNYNEWLDAIEKLKKYNDQELKEKLLNEITYGNMNILLEPKLINMIEEKYIAITNSIIKELEIMFQNEMELDFHMSSFKKNMKFLDDLTYLKPISIDKGKELRNRLKKENNEIYDILINSAIERDSVGKLAMIIENNKYKWSDENEL
jgi:hypothetical protein